MIKTTVFRGFLLTLILTLFFTLSTPIKAEKPAASLLEQLGFQVFESDPIDFSLFDLDGNRVSLKQFKGSWVWLSFWATWCGPCRYEMPILQALHEKYKHKGLEILGINVEQVPKRSIQEFVRDLGITFKILLDSEGRVATSYQARALPTIFVVSPDGKLAGLMRGAREWGDPSIDKILEKLLKEKTFEFSKPLAKTKKAEPQGILPTELLPPKLEIEPLSTPILSQRSVIFRIRMSWEGSARQYELNTPSVTIPEGVTQGVVSSSSSSSLGKETLVYQIPLTFLKAGKISVGPIELAYGLRGQGLTQHSRVEAFEVEVRDPWYFANLSFANLKFILSGLFIVGLSLGLFGWLAFRRRAKTMASSQMPKILRKDLPLPELRQLKVHGPKEKYVLRLIECYLETLQGEKEKIKTTKAVLEKLRYGGYQMPVDEIESIERSMDRFLKDQQKEGILS